MRFPLTIVALALLLPACLAAGPSDLPAAPARPRVSPPRPVPSEAGVWHPGTTKAYVFRRYVDPANPRILHEGHVVYRREDDGGFILQPGALPAVARGPSAGRGRTQAERRPPLANELRAELARQRAATAAINANAQLIMEAKEQLLQGVAEVRALAGKVRAGAPERAEAVRALEERLRRVEGAVNVSPAPIAPPAEPGETPDSPRR